MARRGATADEVVAYRLLAAQRYTSAVMYSCSPKYPPFVLRCGVMSAVSPPSFAAFFCSSPRSSAETVQTGRQLRTRSGSSTTSTLAGCGDDDAQAANSRHAESIHLVLMVGPPRAPFGLFDVCASLGQSSCRGRERETPTAFRKESVQGETPSLVARRRLRSKDYRIATEIAVEDFFRARPIRFVFLPFERAGRRWIPLVCAMHDPPLGDGWRFAVCQGGTNETYGCSVHGGPDDVAPERPRSSGGSVRGDEIHRLRIEGGADHAGGEAEQARHAASRRG